MSGERSIELEVEVVGTPEAVWQAIATGPGISSWYVPHTVEEREGGAATATFGPGMVIPGRVAAWDPPHRIVFDGGEDVEGMAFEWVIEAGGDSTCVVKLINSGFGTGAEWDGQFDAMTDGWGMFLRNLALHLEYFPGQSAASMLATASWPGRKGPAWMSYVSALDVDGHPEVGATIEIVEPNMAGTVVGVGPTQITLLLDEPLPGVAFLAAEGADAGSAVSAWAYLYGDDAETVAAHSFGVWQTWLTNWVEATTPTGK